LREVAPKQDKTDHVRTNGVQRALVSQRAGGAPVQRVDVQDRCPRQPGVARSAPTAPRMSRPAVWGLRSLVNPTLKPSCTHSAFAAATSVGLCGWRHTSRAHCWPLPVAERGMAEATGAFAPAVRDPVPGRWAIAIHGGAGTPDDAHPVQGQARTLPGSQKMAWAGFAQHEHP
jgi:hypothetical protein